MNWASIITSTIKDITKASIKASKTPKPKAEVKTATKLKYSINGCVYTKYFTSQYKAKHYYNWLKEEDRHNRLALLSVDDVIYTGQLNNLVKVEM